MAATVAALSFRGPLAAAPRRSAGFATCHPLRKSNLRRQAAPLLPQPRQTPPPAAAPRRWAPQPFSSWDAPDPASRQGRLFYGGIVLLCALAVYLCGSPTDAVYMLAIALIVMFRPY